MKKTILTLCILVLLAFAGDIARTDASVPAVDVLTGLSSPQAAEPLIIDHNTVDITAVPQDWIEEAKNTLHVYYGHTSHGSQIITGMDGLIGFANGGGLGLNLPPDIFAGLPIQEASPDAGYYPEWVNNTVSYLGTPDPTTGRGMNHPETNVVIWSWCGQVSDISEQDLIDHYLLPMTQLELDYWDITFVYMTGHSDGSGETGNLHIRNQQIRQYVVDNNKTLYDFYDIELYDPDGNYYGDKAVEDDCDYDSDGDGDVDANWCLDWQASHTEGVDWYNVSCAHSNSLNCNQKAYAAWWLWTSIAGWNGVTADPNLSPSSKSASQSTVTFGDTLTYTISIINASGALTNTIQMTDTIPAGLAYLPGSLTATSGIVDDTGAPDLAWTGVLTPTPTITVTFAVTVSSMVSETIINTAVIATPGYGPITRTATIFANGAQPPDEELNVTLAGNGIGTVTSDPAGIDCGTDCSETFASGTMVTLTAAADPGSVFVGWDGDCTGMDDCVVTMDADRSVTATFVLEQPYELSVTLAGNGVGMVTSDPAGIDCGTDCSETFDFGTVVTLTATAEPDSVFVGWAGDCTGMDDCVVTMNVTRSVTAGFVLDQPYELSVTLAGNGVGTVTSDPTGIDCGTDCSETFDFGTVVTLTAITDPGSVFSGWSGACTGMDDCVVTIIEVINVTATFTQEELEFSIFLPLVIQEE